MAPSAVDEAAPAAVEGAGGFIRSFVRSRQRAEAVEERVQQGCHLVHRSGQRPRCPAGGDVGRPLAEGLQGARLALADRHARPAGAAEDGDLRRRSVGDALGEQERRGRFRPFEQDLLEQGF